MQAGGRHAAPFGGAESRQDHAARAAAGPPSEDRASSLPAPLPRKCVKRCSTCGGSRGAGAAAVLRQQIWLVNSVCSHPSAQLGAIAARRADPRALRGRGACAMANGTTWRAARELSRCSHQTSAFQAVQTCGGEGAPGEGDEGDEEGAGKGRRGSFLDHLAGPMKKIKVTLERNENGLGIVLDHTGTPPQQHIWVDELVEGTPAAKCKKIKTGDTLAEVNGENIRWLPIEEVVKLLGTHVVKLTFLRRGAAGRAEGGRRR